MSHFRIPFLNWLRYHAGVRLAKAGMHKHASDQFRAILRTAPDHFTAREWLAVSLERLGKHEEAILAYQELIVRAPHAEWAYGMLGHLLHQLGRHAEAVSNYAAAIERSKPDAWLSFNLGLCHEALGNWKDAAMAFRRASNLRPDDADALALLGIALGKLGHWEEATDCARRALAIEVTVDRAIDLGQALEHEGHNEEAAEVYRRALSFDATSIELKERLGLALIKLRRADEGLRLVREAALDGPPNGIALSTLTFGLIAANRFAEGLTNARQTVERSPNLGYARVALGWALLAACRPVEALEAVEQARQLDQTGMNEAFLLHALAMALEGVDRYVDADRVAREALAVDATVDLKILVARIASSRDRHDEAIGVLQDLRGQYPKDEYVLVSLSDAFWRADRLEEAEDAATRALALDPHAHYARSSLGRVCLRRGDPAKALEHFETARRICPEELRLTANRGAALSALGRHGEAVAVFDDVARAAPDYFTYYADDIKEYVERSRAAVGKTSEEH